MMCEQKAEIHDDGRRWFERSRPFRRVEAVRDGQSGNINTAEGIIGRNVEARSDEPLRLMKTAKAREYADPSVS